MIGDNGWLTHYNHHTPFSWLPRPAHVQQLLPLPCKQNGGSLAFLAFYNFLSCSLNSLSSALVLLSNVADKKEPSPATLAFERPIKGFRLKMVLNGAK